MDQTQSVFKNKNYVLTFLGAMVSNIAAMLLNFATSYYILKITGDDAAIQGIYLFTCGIVFVVFSLFTGVLSDRFNKAKIMFLCDYIKGAAIVLGGILILLMQSNEAGQLVLLFIFGALFNIIAAIFTPASQSLLPFILQEDQLQQGNSYLTGMNGLVAIIGAVVAGVLYSLLPFYLLMIIIGACYICSGISEMFIRYVEEKKEDKLTVSTVFKEIGESFRYLTTKKALVVFIVIILFVNFFFSPIDSNFIPYFVRTDIGGDPNYLCHEVLTPELWGSIISVCFCVGSIIGALILSGVKQMEKVSKFLKIMFTIMASLILAISLAYLFFVYKQPMVNVFIIILCVICVITGAVISFINIPISTVIARTCDKNMLGKVQSLINIGSQGLIPIASFASGFIIQYAGSAILLFSCTAGFILITLVFIFNKSVNEL